MRDDELLDQVEAFVARRQLEPGLEAEAFARAVGEADPRLLSALRRAVEVLATLDGDGDGDPPPTTIADYRIVRELGRGGMGVVYEVERDGRHLALKRLSAAALLQRNAVTRLLREAAALRRIDHPGVVRVHEIGTADGVPHLVMDLVAGPPLADQMPMPWPRAAAIGQRIAAALQAVHAAGLLHRDLKPQNILLTADDQPVLVDFGLVHDDGAATLTGTGDLLGTPGYLAPEQVDGRAADARTDVFALGLVLAELLTGVPVRRATKRSSLLLEAQRGAQPRLPRAVPAAFRVLLARALARRPADRLPSAAVLGAELQRLAAGQPLTIDPLGVVAHARDWLAVRPRRAGATTVTVLGGILALAWAVHSQREEQHAATIRRQFAAAVAMYVGGDHAAARHSALAVLQSDSEHGGASVLATVTAAADAKMPTVASEPLRQMLSHRAAKAWSDAATILAELRTQEPESPLWPVLSAEAETAMGNREAAVADLVAAAALLPQTGGVCAALGAARLAARDPAGAAADYRRAVALEPEAWPFRLQLARALYAVDAATGLAVVEGARELLGDRRPDGWHELLNLQASLLEKLGRTADAIAVFRQLVTAAPSDARFAYNLGYALDRAQAVAEARDWYERALALDPNQRSATLCLVWLLATADPPLGDVDRAATLLVRTLERDRGHSAAVLQMVREFGLRTRQTAALDACLGRLAADPEATTEHRNVLAHTRAFLRNALRERPR